MDVKLRRHRAAKRLTLRVPTTGEGPVVTAPPFVSDDQVTRFVEERQAWIAGALGRLPETIAVTEGTEIPVLGALRVVTVSNGPMGVSGEHLNVRGPETRVSAQVAAVLKTLARERTGIALGRYCSRLGRPYSRLTMRDTRGRWGSCTSDGGIMLSWRLIMTPPEVFDYVVAHEVAHLAEMNHSPAYWAVVAQLYPDFERQRAWLKREGSRLHRYRF
ncbi:MAG: SprT family zinc-dependent metalloprotease [Pseudomonadota bacterium]